MRAAHSPGSLRLLGLGVAALFGFLVSGLTGAALGWVGVQAASHRRAAVVRIARATPLALVVIAAMATMLEAPIDRGSIASDYANAREIASTASRLAAVALFSLVIVAAGRDRATAVIEDAPDASVDQSDPVHERATPTRVAPWWVRRRMHLELAILAVVAAAIRALLAPDPLSDIHAEVARAIERGIAYGRPFATVIEPTAWVSPLAPIVATVAPFGPRLALVAVGTATVVAIAHIAQRLAGTGTARWAGCIAAVAPALWGQQLPAALVTALVCAALLVWPTGERGVARPVWTGALFGLAMLASPAALPATVGAVVMARHRRRAILICLGALLTIAPWHGWVLQNFDSVQPTTGTAPTLAAASAPDVRWGSDIGSLGPVVLPEPSDETAVSREATDRLIGRLGWHVSPPVVAARALRAWDLWPPGNTVAVRTERGLPNPGGTVGAVFQGLVSALALVSFLQRRHRAMIGSLLVAVAMAATIGAGLSFGEREVVASATPAMAIAAAIALSSWVESARQRRHGPDEPEPNGDAQLSASPANLR